MTNRLAIVLGVILVAFFGYDVIANDSFATIFLGRRFIDLIEYLAFWR